MATAAKSKRPLPQFEPYPGSRHQRNIQEVYATKAENPQLWDQLSDWERKFVTDINDLERAKKMITITRGQIERLDELFTKFSAARSGLNAMSS